MRPDQGASFTSTLPDQKDHRATICAVMVVLAVVARAAFWWWTGRTLEDALITLRHAENAARGLGLTHQPWNERPLHGFTSPISVLIPLLSEWVVLGSGMIALKVSSIIAGAISVILGGRLARHPAINLSNWATLFFLGYLALESHQVLFGMAGMEAQCIVALTLYGLLAFLSQSTLQMGLACGLALWGRPDGVILIGAMGLSLLFLGRWKQLAAVLVVAFACIAPWLIFTEIYYGSPVPNTVIAKNAAWSHWPATTNPVEWLGQFVSLVFHRALVLKVYLAPRVIDVNVIRGARPQQLLYFILAVVGCLRLARVPLARIVPIFILAFGAYITVMLPFPHGWYLPMWLAVIALAFAAGTDMLIRWRGTGPTARLGQLLSGGYLVLYVIGFIWTLPAERLLQTCIEDGVRVPTARWLAEHAAPEDEVSMECVGYLGYYSNCRTLDHPGLVSPRSVAILKEQPKADRNLHDLIHVARPRWIALRPPELEHLEKKYPETRAAYQEQARFKADPACLDRMRRLLLLNDTGFIVDEEFIILRREDR
jgi:hypothetical protein